MTSWPRVLLTCLLAAALPLQGFAAATMVGCGTAGGHPSPRDPAATQATAAAATSAHHPHDGHRADHVPDAEPERHAHVADPHADTDASPAASDAKCSACAACCLATALPARLQAFEPSPPTHVFAPIGPSPSPVFLTGGLERPPRTATNPHSPAR